MRSIIFTSFAKTQYREAHNWFEAAQAGLGEQFADQLDAVLSTIKSNPTQFKIAVMQY